VKVLKILGICLAGLIGLGVIGVMVLGYRSPETYVYPGKQVPKRYMKEIRELGLLEEGEKIAYFYSDGMLDIKEGLYFVSDRHLVLYCKDWEEPKTIIDFENITKIDAEYNDSFLEDTYVTVETVSGLEVSFPVSSERKRDEKFVQHIASKARVEEGAQPSVVPESEPEEDLRPRPKPTSEANLSSDQSRG